jgi:hypothetical protein
MSLSNGNNPADGTASVVSSLSGWASQPFTAQMDLTHWALFTGLIIVLVIFWVMILHDLKEELA